MSGFTGPEFASYLARGVRPPASAPAGFDNAPPEELQAKRATVGLKPLPATAKVYRWTIDQVWWAPATDGGAPTPVAPDELSRSARLARVGLPCDAPDSPAVQEFQRQAGGYTAAAPVEPVGGAPRAARVFPDAHVTYVVASGCCVFEMVPRARSRADDGAAAEPARRLRVRAVAGDGVTCLKGVAHSLAAGEPGTSVLPLFNESTPAEARVPTAVT